MKSFRPKSLISTAGPSISKKEIGYVADAAANGWNDNWNKYIKKFEESFAQYIGVKYAMTTSGGTGALQLACASLGIGPGDEVIIPDLTYFACSDVVMLLGAKPVFADILKDTWCIDPQSVKSLITKRTKAIMPVSIYGNLCEMDEIQKIAKDFNLFVIEDACPAIGSIYNNRRPGSFGDFGAFSFQGAKIMVTGTGGMLVTNSKKLYDKSVYLNNHGEDSKRKFWQTSVGHSTELSNLQAAFGLAQLERIESFVNKKRKIFSWYEKGLKGIEGITLNYERKNTRSNFWMSSVILERNDITRDLLMKELKKQKIDSRPFFYPISMFPMYKEANTPIAHHVSLRGINLPSGVMRTKEEIDYVIKIIRTILR